MKIITGFKHPSTPEWNKMLENLKRSAERFGNEVLIFDLPTQDAWIAGQPELYLSLCWKYKVLFMIDALDKVDDDLIWIDGDCLVVKPVDIEAALAGDCDVAFTLRDIADRRITQRPERDGLVNSGVVFLKNNFNARRFLNMARDRLTLALYDQEAFNCVLLEHSPMENHGEIFSFEGIRVKMLNCREYNNFYFKSDQAMARVLHFKGEARNIYDVFLKKEGIE